MKNANKQKITFTDIIAGLVFGIIFVFIMIAAITPDKDKFGNYTQPWQYWTDQAYFEANF